MKKLIKIIGNILAVLSILFVVRSISKMDIDYKYIFSIPNIWILVLVGCIIAFLWIIVMGVAWKRAIDYFAGNKCSTFKAVKIYAKANLGKYIPGNVMHYVERNVFASDMGLDHLEVATSTVLEIVGMVIATVTIGCIFAYDKLFLSLKNVLTFNYILLIVAGILAIIFMVLFLIKKNKKIQAILHKLLNLHFIKMYLANLTIYVLSFLVLGMLMAMLVAAIEGKSLSVDNIFLIISAYVIAFVIGFVIPGAPGGIGVREFVLSLIMAGSEYADAVLIAAIIHRFITVFGGDIMGYLFAVGSESLKT